MFLICSGTTALLSLMDNPCKYLMNNDICLMFTYMYEWKDWKKLFKLKIQWWQVNRKKWSCSWGLPDFFIVVVGCSQLFDKLCKKLKSRSYVCELVCAGLYFDRWANIKKCIEWEPLNFCQNGINTSVTHFNRNGW